MSKKFYRSVLHAEVLSEDEPVAADDRAELHYQITEGHCSGMITNDERDE